MNINVNHPTVIYSCKGLEYVCYAIWSIRSLQMHGYNSTEVIVSNQSEKEFITSHCADIICNVVTVDQQGYPAFSYKPFVLKKYLRDIGMQHKADEIVICDVDILWKHDPAILFNRFSGHNWVHKITAVTPQDYDIPVEQIKPSNIGLRTIQNYAGRFGVDLYPNFIVNAGLFMLSQDVFAEMLDRWMDKILGLPANEMLMSEALMSLTYAEMGLVPISDREDIKYFGKENAESRKKIFSFNIAPEREDGQMTGYETARHYFGDQREKMIDDAIAMCLDSGNLSAIVRKSILKKKLRKIPSLPSKLLSRFKRA